MATNKQINSRLQLKHDIEANWITAGENGFIPLAGEAIIYDKDDTHESSRIKIGDGTTNINELTFVTEINWNASEGEPGHVLNRTHYEEIKHVVIAEEQSYGNRRQLKSNILGYQNYNGTFCGDKIISGDTYIVTVDGVSYEGVAQQQDDKNSGHPYIFGVLAEFGEEPITLTVSKDGNNNKYVTIRYPDSGTHTVSLTHVQHNIIKLDEKFLPDSLTTVVQFTPQTLTEEQKEQARANIGSEILSDDEMLMWLNSADVVKPIVSTSGEIYTDTNGEIYIL